MYLQNLKVHNKKEAVFKLLIALASQRKPVNKTKTSTERLSRKPSDDVQEELP